MMNKFYNLIFITSLITGEIPAQPPTIVWQRCLGGTNTEASSRIVNIGVDNYTLLLGSQSIDGDVSGNHAGSWDPWIVNIDSSGGIVWEGCLGGSLFDVLFSKVILPSGNILFCGATQSDDGDVFGNHNPGTFDGWLVETDITGNIIRQKCLGGTGSEEFDNLTLLNNGEIIITGITTSTDGDLIGTTNHGGIDIWLIKVDSNWNIEWQKRFGGSDDDNPRSIIREPNGGYILGGFSNSTNGDISTPLGGQDFWILKLDSSGDKVWDRSYGGSQTDMFTNMLAGDSGCYILCGFTESNDGDVTNNKGGRDYWAVKIDSSGNIIWQKCYGGTNDEQSYSFKKDFDNGYIIIGYSSSADGDVIGIHTGGCFPSPCADIWMIKIDNLGSLIWQKCMGGTDGEFGDDFIVTEDTGYLVIGEAYSIDGDVSGGGNHGNIDSWVVKLSTTGADVGPINQLKNFTLLSHENFLNVTYFDNIVEEVVFELLDVSGRVLLSENNTACKGLNKKVIQIDELGSGMYFVKLITRNGSVSKKFIR